MLPVISAPVLGSGAASSRLRLDDGGKQQSNSAKEKFFDHNDSAAFRVPRLKASERCRGRRFSLR
jgi:hypothetical protein